MDVPVERVPQQGEERKRNQSSKELSSEGCE
jgi:hypothetical protein